jgi:hypothetical protein
MGVPIMNRELDRRDFGERIEDLRNEPEKHKSLVGGVYRII